MFKCLNLPIFSIRYPDCYKHEFLMFSWLAIFSLCRTAVWRNGIASDYEVCDDSKSGDCRFDPCLGHPFSLDFVARSSYPELGYSNRLLWVDEGRPLSLPYARPPGLYGSPNVKVRVS